MILKITGFVGNFDINNIEIFINNQKMDYEIPTAIDGDSPYSLIVKLNNKTERCDFDGFPFKKVIKINGFEGCFYIIKIEF